MIFIAVPPAQAGSLTISASAESKIEAYVEGEKFVFKARYIIKNDGDEPAREVYPVFQIGRWKFSAEPRNIEPQNAESWDIEEHIPTSAVSCESYSGCAGLSLPTLGRVPVLVLRLYKDLRGYSFSAADVEIVDVGPMTKGEASRLRTSDLQAKLNVVGNGQEFGSELEIINTEMPVDVVVSFFTSRELQIIAQPKRKALGPYSRAYFDARVENFSGTEGSQYAMFGIVQWDDKGLRNTLVTAGLVPIHKKEVTNYYVMLMVFGVVSLILLLYFFVYRAYRQEKELT